MSGFDPTTPEEQEQQEQHDPIVAEPAGAEAPASDPAPPAWAPPPEEPSVGEPRLGEPDGVIADGHVASASGAADQWVAPPTDPLGGAAAAAAFPPPQPPPVDTAPVDTRPPVDTPPHGQSHNPVDRLTRGLPHPVRVTIDWVVTIAGAIVIVLLVKAFVVNPYRIPSSSMEPTLHCAQPAVGCEARFSDRVLANRFIYHLRSPRRGEIVVFKTPPEAQIKCGAGGTFVKRLIGLPGETIAVRVRDGNSYVYINGKQLKEPYIQPDRRRAATSDPMKPLKLKAGQYFMMGDNRSQSCDSRMWGPVPRANLIGKVFATYWPPNRISLH